MPLRRVACRDQMPLLVVCTYYNHLPLRGQVQAKLITHVHVREWRDKQQFIGSLSNQLSLRFLRTAHRQYVGMSFTEGVVHFM